MFALWTAVTALVLAGILEGVADDPIGAGYADRLDRHAGLRGPDLIVLLRRNLVDVVDQFAGHGLAGLELDARVKVLGVLANDHQVDGPIVEEGPHAGVVLAGPHAGEQARPDACGR